MSLSHKHVGQKILAKIKISVLTRAELLFKVYAMRYPVFDPALEYASPKVYQLRF